MQRNASPAASPRSDIAAAARGLLQRRPAQVGLAAVATVAAALALLPPASQAEDKKAPEPRPALTVTTSQPQRGSLPLRLEASGSVAAWQEAVIGSESNGLKLTDVKVNVGDAVKAGQVLATFSSDTTNAEVAQARASLLEAEASAAEATANADRARTLAQSGALSESQINQYVTGGQTAQAKVAAARAALNAQQLRLRYTQVVAPDSGVISARSATVGSVVGAGTELFRMVRKGRLEWRGEVTSAELGRIRAGQKVQVTAASGATVEGTVRMLAPTVDPQTRNALVYVDLPSIGAQAAAAKGTPVATGAAAGPVLPGMFARGVFLIGAADALTVPQQAVVSRDGFTYVFALGTDANGRTKVTQQKIETGRRSGSQVEVLRGLDANARVAVDGAGFLNDGDLVRVVDGAARPAGAASAAAPAASR